MSGWSNNLDSVFSKVDDPLAAVITCGLVSVRPAYLDPAIFLHSFLQKCSNTVRLCGDWVWIACFRFSHRFSIGLRFGLWLGHSRISTLLTSDHFCVALDECLWSLSCWKKSHLLPLQASHFKMIRKSELGRPHAQNMSLRIIWDFVYWHV